ncbi:unnamed protein product [Effrenium voratum]|uniref:Uncharacterized protein n=1 Tax=Effrenium voratum TaxID=2562239 RepID=A0AA36HQ35_9DINO|nr:unnamed protein product [Effrenium voratum]CAJ1430379.1 unnamed protein product [Effrenium voratum]
MPRVLHASFASDELNAERLVMPKLPPQLKQQLFKTPKLRQHLATQAQSLLDLAELSGPDSAAQIREGFEKGLEALNHEADLHPLQFQQSLKELAAIEKMVKVHSVGFLAFLPPPPRSELKDFL